MNKYKRLASNTLVLALGQFGSKLLVILMVGFYQGQLNQDGYGVVTNIVDISTLLMAFATLSIGESIIRFGLDKNYRKGQVFSIGLTTTIFGLTVCLLFVPAVNFLYSLMPDSELFQILSENAWLIYAYVFSGSIKSCCALFVRSAGYIRLYAVDGIVTTIANILFNLILLLGFQWGVFGYILSVILADVCSIVFLFIIADLKQYFQLFGLSHDLRKAMLAFSIPMIPATIMWWINNVCDGFFITEMMGSSYTGLYKSAYLFPNVIALVSGIFSQAWNMSAISEKNSRTISKFYSNVFNIYQSVVFVIAAGMLFAIKFLIQIFCDDAFFTAYLYAPALIMSVVFSCFATFMGSIYVATKKSVRSMVTVLAGAVLNIILNAILIPAFGIQGAAVATFASYFVVYIARVIDSKKYLYMEIDNLKIVVNCVLLTIMCFFVFLIKDDFIMYFSLGILFLVVLLLNFKTMIKAIKQVLGKNKDET